MNGTAMRLPVITSCTACGACCLVVTAPPFQRVFDGEGEEAWERLRRERPDLVDAIVADARARRQAGIPSYGTPCSWFEPATRACRHYDHRPRACRDFAIGAIDCHDARRRAGIDATAFDP
ncbi:MAG: YkgJ family cysteine cluster protein [Isosphaeraceae bacterium]|nr:YkgJ family cysteine cluster protein [Isosphaeraceae bacterium]